MISGRSLQRKTTRFTGSAYFLAMTGRYSPTSLALNSEAWTLRLCSENIFCAAFPMTAERRTLASATTASKGTEILSNVSLSDSLQFQQPGEIMAQALADFPAPIVGQPIRRFERDVHTRDLPVFCDQERLGTAKIAGAFCPDFTNARHLHGDHLKRYFIITAKCVNTCVHILRPAKLEPGTNINILKRRGI